MEKLPKGKFKYFERYEHPYTKKLKKVSVTLTKDSPQARNEATRILNKKITDKINEVNKTDLPLGDLIDDWYKEHRKTLRPTSQIVYDSVIKRFKQFVPEDVMISRVDSKLFQKALNEMDFANETMNRMKSIMNMVMDYAVRMEYITTNPLINVKTPKKAKTLDDLQRIENKYLEKNELKDILTILQKNNYSRRNGLLAEFLALTGMRIGEAIGLSVSEKERNYDKENKIAHVTGTINIINGRLSDAKKGLPKTLKSHRDVGLPDRAAEILDTLITENKIMASRSAYTDKGYIFTTRSGNPIGVNSFNHSIKIAGEKAKIDKNLSSHIFRHTHISQLAELGIPEKAIMDRVGHSDDKVTRMVYTHVTKNMKISIVDQMNALG